jgi:hypothetical protein
MMRIMSLLCLALLAGCALPGGAAFEQGAAGQYDFNWRLSGDRAVGPLQVFGTGRQIWLQFAAGQQVPAIFASTPQGDVPLTYRRQDPYVIVDGAWQSLVLRGGRHTARAVRQDAAAAGATQTPPISQEAPKAPQEAPQVQIGAEKIKRDASQSRPVLGRHAPLTEMALAPTALASRASPSSTAQTAPAQTSPLKAPPAPVQAALRAGPPDSTLRGVLARWAASSGWTFEPQHWAVDVDIPLAGAAQFPGDFKAAVRALLASTELSERPVQPCFYANRVLRVVAYTQACDRSTVPAGAAS